MRMLLVMRNTEIFINKTFKKLNIIFLNYTNVQLKLSCFKGSIQTEVLSFFSVLSPAVIGVA